MPNPAASLSAASSLSLMPGGQVAAGGVTGTPASQGTNSADFKSFLDDRTGYAPPAIPQARRGASAADTPSGPSATQARDAAADLLPASSGKNLPLAAPSAATLPLPVTLEGAGIDASTGQDDAADASGTAQDPVAAQPGATSQMPDAAFITLAQSCAATPLAQPAALPPIMPANQPVGVTPPTAKLATGIARASFRQSGSGAAASAPATPTASLTADADPALPRPGFTLLSNEADEASETPTGQGTNPMTAALASASLTAATGLPGSWPIADQSQPGFTLPAVAINAPVSADQTPSVTIRADVASAMADPTSLLTASPQPGFTLLADASSNTGTPAIAGNALAQASPAGRQPSSETARQEPSDTAPGFATIQLASASAQTAPARLAPARKNALQTVSARSVAAPQEASTLSASGNASTDPAANASSKPPASSEDQPGFTSLHSPTSPSADGASIADNAPNPIPSLASAGAVAPQALAMSGGAPNPSAMLAAATPSATSANISSPAPDMAALVDRLVEARAAARSGLGAQSTLATIAHADFGRVSLRFDQDDAGLSISMSSKDPGFAPAAQAALAQAPAVAASAQGHGAGAQSGNGQGSGQSSQLWAQASLSSGSPGGQSAGGNSSGSGGQPWQSATQNAAPDPARASLTGTASSDGSDTASHRRGGILA